MAPQYCYLKAIYLIFGEYVKRMADTTYEAAGGRPQPATQKKPVTYQLDEIHGSDLQNWNVVQNILRTAQRGQESDLEAYLVDESDLQYT